MPSRAAARFLFPSVLRSAAVTASRSASIKLLTLSGRSPAARSTGFFTLVRPDRLRWELAPPDDVVYWVTPEGLAYKSAAGQGKVPAASQKIAAALGDLRILLGGDLAQGDVC